MDVEDNGADILRITLIGPSQAGKSTFATSVVSRSVGRIGSYHRTVKNVVRYVNLRPREGLGIHLEDTVGVNKLIGDNLDVARNQVFIVFFDWSRPETRKMTLDMIAEIRLAETKLKRRPPRPIFLVGNKRDITTTQELERDLDKLRKAAYSGNFFLFSGSVINNSFQLLEKPRRYEKALHMFDRLFDFKGGDDYKLNYSSVQLVDILRSLFDETCGVGWNAVDKSETNPLLPSSSVEPADEEELGWCARICGCCSRRGT